MNLTHVRSQIYREYLLSRKTISLILCIMLIFTCLGWLCFLSMRVGNLAKLLEEIGDGAEGVRNNVYLVFLYLPSIFSVSLLGTSVGLSDVKSGYRTYAYTLPATPLERTAARYILKLILMLIAMGFAALNVCIISAMADQPVTAKVPALVAAGWTFLLLTDQVATVSTVLIRHEKDYGLVQLLSLVIMVPFYVKALQWMREVLAEAEARGMDLDDPATMVKMVTERLDPVMEHAGVLPYAAVAAVLALGFVCCLIAMKRRPLK